MAAADAEPVRKIWISTPSPASANMPRSWAESTSAVLSRGRTPIRTMLPARAGRDGNSVTAPAAAAAVRKAARRKLIGCTLVAGRGQSVGCGVGSRKRLPLLLQIQLLGQPQLRSGGVPLTF